MAAGLEVFSLAAKYLDDRERLRFLRRGFESANRQTWQQSAAPERPNTHPGGSLSLRNALIRLK